MGRIKGPFYQIRYVWTLSGSMGLQDKTCDGRSLKKLSIPLIFIGPMKFWSNPLQAFTNYIFFWVAASADRGSNPSDTNRTPIASFGP
jgi:hypothetical protein